VAAVASPLLASIPSPSQNSLGPLNAYGLMLAIGVIVAYFVTDRRWRRMGGGAETVGDIALWTVIWGVIGARVYHLVSDIQLYTGRGFDGVVDAFKIWDGGLSIWGAVLGGSIALVVQTRRRHLDSLRMLDAVAPGVLAAQAIGRWGNWWNQELFGRPTDLPWGLEIDFAHRPQGYKAYETFHPTFLYESLWCLVVIGVILWAERRFRFKRGQSFALYVVLYTAGRFVWENLRIDPANEWFGLRLNAWVTIGVFLFGVVWFLWLGRRNAPVPELEPGLGPARPFGVPATEGAERPAGDDSTSAGDGGSEPTDVTSSG
jgi:prolipoprotein diacylglyceryl transferase